MSGQPQKFDATLRHLIARHPRDWLRFIGVTTMHFRPRNTKLSTVTREADQVFEIGRGKARWVLNLEAQTSYDRLAPYRFNLYNALLANQFHCAVRNVVMLLRPEADGPAMSGRLWRTVPAAHAILDFQFDVIRVWEIPAERLASAGPGLAPLAVLGDLGGPWEERVPVVIRELHDRFHDRAAKEPEQEFWSDVFLLLGLKCSEDQARLLLRGVPGMRESTTYQAILREGREEGLEQGREEGREEALRVLRESLTQLGTDRFGLPPKRVQTELRKLDLVTAQRLFTRIMNVESWAELMR